MTGFILIIAVLVPIAVIDADWPNVIWMISGDLARITQARAQTTGVGQVTGAGSQTPKVAEVMQTISEFGG